MNDPQADLRFLAQQIKTCTACPLSENRTQAIPGIGLASSPAVLVGEKPSYWDDRQGIPFAGNAGEFFDWLLQEVGLTRRQLFLTTAVKCLPPKGFRLSTVELDACAPWLEEQLALIAPKVVIAVGNPALARWFPGQRIGEIHGQPRRAPEFIVVPTYHPSQVLWNEAIRPVILADFRVVARLVKEFL
jgi:uracil-DNA glycosylase family 4